MSTSLVLRSNDVNTTNLNRPILVLIRGLPGSGKSYLSTAIQQLLGGPVVVLDPDATDYSSTAYTGYVQNVTAQGVDPSLHVYRFLREQAYAGITAHQIILWNQPFTNREIFQKMTSGLINYAINLGTTLDILVVELGVDTAVAKERVDERKQAGGHGPSDTTFDRFTNDYVSFADEGFPTLSLDGSKDIQASANTVVAKIDDIVTTQTA